MAVGRVILRVLGFSYVTVVPPSVRTHLDVNTDITKRRKIYRELCSELPFFLGSYAAAL
jgi:hypothetical protein